MDMATLANLTIKSPQKDVVTAAVLKIIDGIAAVDAARSKASKVLDAHKAEANKARKGSLLAIAKASSEMQWIDSEITDGIDAAVTLRGGKEKLDTTMRTWVSQLRTASCAAVRAHVAPIFTLCEAAWKAEQAAVKADKTAPRPLARGFSNREFFMALALMSEAKAGNLYPDIPSLVAFAETRDPIRDAQGVAAKLKTIRDQLGAFAAEFPHAGITACDDLLKALTAQNLIDARNAAIGVTAAPAAAPAAAPLEGASDVLASLDGELDAAIAAAA
jgi:hypothetical protein